MPQAFYNQELFYKNQTLSWIIFVSISNFRHCFQIVHVLYFFPFWLLNDHLWIFRPCLLKCSVSGICWQKRYHWIEPCQVNQYSLCFCSCWEKDGESQIWIFLRIKCWKDTVIIPFKHLSGECQSHVRSFYCLWVCEWRFNWLWRDSNPRFNGGYKK